MMTSHAIGRRIQTPRRIFSCKLRISVRIQNDALMRPVTINARTHSERAELRNSLHRFDRTMTSVAVDAGDNMSRMIKHDMVRHIIYLHPFDRLIVFQSRFDLQDLGRIFQNLRMAIHTTRCRRNASDG